MKNEIKEYTTREQSEHLVELGFPIELATAHYKRFYNQSFGIDGEEEFGWDLYLHFDPEKHVSETRGPSFSLSALIDFLPNFIDSGHASPSELCLCKTKVCYKYYDFVGDCDKTQFQACNDSFFECVYDTVCWLLENNLMPKEDAVN